MATALEQQREDAALGAAWRRAQELTADAGTYWTLWLTWDPFLQINPSYNAQANADGPVRLTVKGSGNTATAALEALVTALETKKEQD